MIAMTGETNVHIALVPPPEESQQLEQTSTPLFIEVTRLRSQRLNIYMLTLLTIATFQ